MTELLLVAALVSAPGPEQPPEQPGRELLEFLGSFEDEEGQWLDPLTLPDSETQGDESPSERDDDENEYDQVPERDTDQPDGGR